MLAEARSRQAALQQQWAEISENWVSKDPARFDPAAFNEHAFLRAFAVVLANASYLPSAECFALLPLAGQLGRTGNDNGCDLDYDSDLGAVVVKSARPYRCACVWVLALAGASASEGFEGVWGRGRGGEGRWWPSRGAALQMAPAWRACAFTSSGAGGGAWQGRGPRGTHGELAAPECMSGRPRPAPGAGRPPAAFSRIRTRSHAPAARDCRREGQEVLLNDGRPNGEMLLNFGSVQDNNLSDYLLFDATLVRADK